MKLKCSFELVDRTIFLRDFMECYFHGNLSSAIDMLSKSVDNKEFRAEMLAAKCYFDLQKPKRATVGSAGYDFFFPFRLTIPEGMTVRIPTGIVWKTDELEDTYGLFLYPRSSLGIHYTLREPNGVSVIDADYYGNSSNGGHIFVNLRNEGHNGSCVIQPNKGYVQGVIQPIYLVDDDDTTSVRTGGSGSTDSQKISF